MLNCSISGKGETIRTTNSVMSLTRQGSHGSHPLSPTVPQFDAQSTEAEALRSVWGVKRRRWGVKRRRWGVKRHWGVKRRRWGVKRRRWGVKRRHWGVKRRRWGVKRRRWGVKRRRWGVKRRHWGVKRRRWGVERSGKEGLRRDRRMTLQGIRINDKQIVWGRPVYSKH